MRRLLGWWLFFCAFAACMIPIHKALADNNAVEIKAVAVCKGGQCVMAEADYKKLQEFVKETQAAARKNNEIERGVNETLAELQGSLEKCQDQRQKWKS